MIRLKRYILEVVLQRPLESLTDKNILEIWHYLPDGVKGLMGVYSAPKEWIRNLYFLGLLPITEFTISEIHDFFINPMCDIHPDIPGEPILPYYLSEAAKHKRKVEIFKDFWETCPPKTLFAFFMSPHQSTHKLLLENVIRETGNGRYDYQKWLLKYGKDYSHIFHQLPMPFIHVDLITKLEFDLRRK